MRHAVAVDAQRIPIRRYSEARIATTLLHKMKRRNASRGLATMCVGVGQGVARLFERGG